MCIFRLLMSLDQQLVSLGLVYILFLNVVGARARMFLYKEAAQLEAISIICY